MLYSRLNDSHTAFEAERNLMTRTFGLDGGGTIAADSAGHVYVAWHAKTPGAMSGEAGRQVWIAESDDDGKTFTMWAGVTSSAATRSSIPSETAAVTAIAVTKRGLVIRARRPGKA